MVLVPSSLCPRSLDEVGIADQASSRSWLLLLGLKAELTWVIYKVFGTQIRRETEWLKDHPGSPAGTAVRAACRKPVL